MRGNSSWTRFWILCCVTMSSMGCGGSGGSSRPMGDVTGIVTYQNKPVVGANIVFLPTTRDTPAGAAITDSGGRYKLSVSGHQTGAVTGSYQVSIALNAPYDGPIPEGMSPEMAKENFPGKPLIPQKYFAAATSKLTAEVKPGSNTFNFVLAD